MSDVSRTSSNNARAIMWMVVSVLCFSAMSLLVKQASNAGLAPFQIVFFRVLFGFLAILPFALIAGPSVLRTKRHVRHMLRSAVGVSAMTLLFVAFSQLNMTETVALNFTVPFFVTLGAVLFLGETIRLRRIAATVVGFLGVLVVAQPWSQALVWAQLLPLLAAVLMATAFLVVKDLTKTESTIRMVTFQGFWMSIYTVIPMMLVWQNPDPQVWLMLIGAGVIATAGQWALTLAARQGEASAVMPFDYLRLPFVALLELTVLGVVPELASLIGGGIIAVAAIYMARREARIRPRPLAAESKTFPKT
ncbi:MAG: DMT family transporter [Alphaproteobacteria bacterium]